MRRTTQNRRASLRALARSIRRTSDKEVVDVALTLWKSLDTPLSLGLSLLAKNGQFEELLRVEIDPLRYPDWDVDQYRNDAQAISFLKKMPLEIGIDREKVAWDKFLESERLCQATNERFRRLREGKEYSPAVQCILHSAQWKISRWLGDLDSKAWALRCRFGPGADATTSGARTSAYHKLSQLSSTEDFADGAAALVYSHPSWAAALHGLAPDEPSSGLPPKAWLTLQPGNKLTFVPKTALVDRSIAIEPQMNIYAQLGLGALLRQRLKRHAGLDLDTQVPSQALAHLGSVKGTVATIDLSSASDTIAKELVRDLLPSPWFNAMDWCRSKVGLYNDGIEDKTLYYQKFSSMGNGFTFELESMIFYALALSCVEATSQDVRLVRAFGDDIAIPVKSVDLLEKVIEFCGFVVNKKKSFSSSVFRESCGADYFNGVDVRPYYQKESLTHVEALFRLANGIRCVAVRRNRYFGCDIRLYRTWSHVVRRIPPSLRTFRGPFRHSERFKTLGVTDVTSDDSYLASNLDECMSGDFVRRDPDGRCGWLFAGIISSGRRVSALRDFALLHAYALYSCRDAPESEEQPRSPLGFSRNDPGNYSLAEDTGTLGHSSKNGTTLVPLRGGGPRKLSTSLFADVFLDVGPWI